MLTIFCGLVFFIIFVILDGHGLLRNVQAILALPLIACLTITAGVFLLGKTSENKDAQSIASENIYKKYKIKTNETMNSVIGEELDAYSITFIHPENESPELVVFKFKEKTGEPYVSTSDEEFLKLLK